MNLSCRGLTVRLLESEFGISATSCTVQRSQTWQKCGRSADSYSYCTTTRIRLYTQHCVLTTVSASSICTTKLRALQNSMQLFLVANSFINKLSSQPFYILLYNISAKAMHAPKQTAVAYATDPQVAVMANRPTSHQYLSTKPPEKIEIFAYSDDNSVESDASSTNCKGKVESIDVGGAVH